MNIIVAVLILGIIVIIHELGHFLLAKKNGVTVTEFSVGMGPRIASFVHKGTRYSLKILPIGGSCMMLGEDETVEDEGAFHKKGVWARFSVIFAGAFFNFIFAFILALILIANIGVDKPIVNSVKSGSVASSDFKAGDQIIKINNDSIHFFREIDFFFYFNPVSDKPIHVTYLRNGKEYKTTITPKWVNTYQLGFTYNSLESQAKMDEVRKDYPLDKAGIKVGDVITAVNGTKINSGSELTDYLNANPLSDKPVNITYLRGGKEITVAVIPALSGSKYEIGWNLNTYRNKVSALEVVKYSFYEVKYNIDIALKSLKYLITGKVSAKEITGPVGIVDAVGKVVDNTKTEGIRITILNLISFCILLSANLGVMNLLPLPALDGGRLIFILIEAIRRKPVPKEKEAMVHMVGMVLLMLLMVFVLFNDISRIVG